MGILFIFTIMLVIAIIMMLWEVKVEEWHDHNPDPNSWVIPFWVRFYDHFFN